MKFHIYRASQGWTIHYDWDEFQTLDEFKSNPPHPDAELVHREHEGAMVHIWVINIELLEDLFKINNGAILLRTPGYVIGGFRSIEIHDGYID